MPLVPCRECGARISTEATACPRCGVPDPSRPSTTATTPHTSIGASTPSGPSLLRILAYGVAAVAVLLLVASVVLSQFDSGPSREERIDRGDSLMLSPEGGVSAVFEAEGLMRDGDSAAAYNLAMRIAAFHAGADGGREAQYLLERLRPYSNHLTPEQRAEARALSVAADSARRAAASVAAAEAWTYASGEDPMTGRAERTAAVESANAVTFEPPYGGPQRARLTLRDHPQFGRDVLLEIERGQFLCRSYNDCTVAVRFDDGEPERWEATGPKDNSTTVIFLRPADRFRERLVRASTVRIQADVYRNGAPIFEFAVGGFDAARLR